MMKRPSWKSGLTPGCVSGNSAIEADKQGSEDFGSERPPLRLEVGLLAAAAALQRGFVGDKGGFAGPLSGFGLPYGTVPPRGDMVLPASQAGLDAMAWGPGSASDGLAFCEEDDDDPSQPDSTAQEASFNNRVGGGAGKRLSLQELQASILSLKMPLSPAMLSIKPPGHVRGLVGQLKHAGKHFDLFLHYFLHLVS